MLTYNHLWQINKYMYREIGCPVGVVDGFLYLLRNGIKYRILDKWVALYVPLNKYYIQIGKVNKYLERVEQ